MLYLFRLRKEEAEEQSKKNVVKFLELMSTQMLFKAKVVKFNKAARLI